MINKKILLSLLTVGLLAFIASAGTWAYFQDTVNSTGNQLTTATLTSEYSLDAAQSTWTSFSANNGLFGPFTVNNLVPDSIPHIIQPIHVRNLGTTDATVTATITPGTPVDEVQNLVIQVGQQTIYTAGVFVTPSPLVLNLGTVMANGSAPVDASISYTFTDTEISQNPDETHSIPFNMSIVEKAIAPV
jgi:predicted ribosomally synthesized peptide with SipW-like signal peptide